MILEAMFFVLGVVAASLLALFVTPVVARRAARRTQERLLASLPSNLAEVAAEKDQLRARFAVRQRRLESAIGRLNEKIAARMVESGQQREQIAGLVTRQGELSASLAGLERQMAGAATTLERTEHRLHGASAEVALRGERLVEAAAEIRHLESNVAIRDILTEEQRVELAARETRIDSLSLALSAANATGMTAATARDQLAAELATERARVAELSEHVRGMDAAQSVLATERVERLAELERRADEIETLKATLAQAEQAHHDEVAALQSDLAALRAGNVELQRAMDAGAAPSDLSAARLRARLDEIALQVVRMSEARGPRPLPVQVNGHASGAPRERLAPAANADDAGERLPLRTDPNTLGDRLRAIQRVAARH